MDDIMASGASQRLAGLLLASLVFSSSARAQAVLSDDQARTQMLNAVQTVATSIVNARLDARRAADEGKLILALHGNQLGVALGRARVLRGRAQLLLEAEQTRTDKQVGGGSGASGTTSLVSKGGVPAILGLAVENGALTQTTTGTTITFTGNPVGLIQTLENKGFLATSGASDPVLQVLGRISFSASFDASRGQTSPTFTGDRQQLSAWSIRGQLINHRDPRHSPLWNTMPALVVVADKQLDWFNAAEASLVFQGWYAPLQSLVASATTANQIRDVILDAIERFPFDTLEAPTKAALGDFSDAVAKFEAQRTEVLDRVKKGLLITLDYIDDRPLDRPEISTLTAIVEKGGGGPDYTANFSISLLQGAIPNTAPDRLHDIQASGQVDFPMLRSTATGTFLFSVAGKYQYMRQDPAVAAPALTTPSSTIAVVQAKLTIPLGSSGAKVPLSVSWANRTELLPDTKEIKGNIGITFDLDAIFARRP